MATITVAVLLEARIGLLIHLIRSWVDAGEPFGDPLLAWGCKDKKTTTWHLGHVMRS